MHDEENIKLKLIWCVVYSNETGWWYQPQFIGVSVEKVKKVSRGIEESTAVHHMQVVPPEDDHDQDLL